MQRGMLAALQGKGNVLLWHVYMHSLASSPERPPTLKCFASWVSIRAVFPILRCLRTGFLFMHLLHVHVAADLWSCHPFSQDFDGKDCRCIADEIPFTI